MKRLFNALKAGSLRGGALALLLVVTSVSSAPADQSTGLLVVSATVLSVCGVAATPLVFGNYSGTGSSPTDATSIVTALCTAGVPYTISMNEGTGTGGTVVTRKLTSGGNLLNYTLYTDANRTTIWGDGTSSTATVTGTGGLLPQTHTVYGRIPASQLSSFGVYGDLVTITIAY